MRRLAAWLLIAGSAGCAEPTAPPSFATEGFDARQFKPGSQYELWWGEVSECAGRTGDLSAVRFFEVLSPLSSSGQQFACFDGRFCSGAWEPPDEIYLASGSLMVEQTVKHEMLHALLQDRDHGSVLFRCNR